MNSPSSPELAAIVIAVEALWPASATAPPSAPSDGGRWRFSGRWWEPDVSRRHRR